jgi:putative copper export protein
MSKADLWQGVLYLHLLAMSFFVGGQLLLEVAVVPVERNNPDPVRLRAIARRFGLGSLMALGVLLATGVAMASHYQLWDSGTLQLKLGLVAGVLVLTVLHLRHPRAHALQGAIFAATLGIVWLGLDFDSVTSTRTKNRSDSRGDWIRTSDLPHE